MKKIYILLVFVLFTSLSQAQIVNIPDANFKTALLNYQPVIDTNNDGEIQVSEAQAVITLNLNYVIFTTGLTGLEAFVNLENLYLGFYNLTSLDVSMLVNLKDFSCSTSSLLSNINVSNLNSLTSLSVSNCNLSNLDLTGCNNITYLNCTNNKLTSLDISNLSNLQYLDCSDQADSTSQGISNLDFSGLNNIILLNCSGNNLTNLDVSNLTNLLVLNCKNQRFQNGDIGISSIDVSALTNLLSLNVGGNSIETLELYNLTQLTSLDCFGNQITNLDVTNNPFLTRLGCSNNFLTSLDLSNSSNLTTLLFDNNQINNINLSNLTNLIELNVGVNQLTTIDVSNLNNLIFFSCYNNQLSNLNVSNLENLRVLNADSNLFTNIDLSTTGINSNNFSTFYSLSNNPNLAYINIKNGLSINYTPFANCPNLQYVCADDFNIQHILQNLLANGNVTNVQVNSYCTFLPGGINNKITGTLTLDINNSGCDTNDLHPLDLKINVNDGFISGATFCNANGGYSFFNQTGSFTLTPQFQNNYFTVTPISATLNFPILDGSTQIQDFCITPNGVFKDVDITIIPLGTARPGFDAHYQLVYKNKGNQTLSGAVNLTFDDAVLDFVSANPTLYTQSINNLGWNYINLLPFESRTINFTLNLNSPMEIPAVNINDFLNYVATINPVSGDETPTDNNFELNQTVGGSFDPNDKTCLEGETITPDKVGEYLHYLIRFQNSGTSSAENIVVKDIIDTNKFDMNSLQLISASHLQKTKITNNKVEFIFEEINLPAELVNEPQSHGYVAFKIKTKDNLIVGNTVSNTAAIYFDYNFPIVTNTATTTFTALGINQFINKSVSFYPNPTKNNVTISANDNITSIQLLDVQGRLIETKLNNSTETKLDLSKQLSGIYFIKVYTEKGIKTEKIIKE